MYHFPNLDNTTRLIMIAELERDLNGINETSKPNQLTTLPNEKACLSKFLKSNSGLSLRLIQ